MWFSSNKQQLTDIEVLLSEALQNIDLLAKRVDAVQTKNDKLEHDIVEGRKREEVYKQEVERKFKTNVKRISSLEGKIKH